MSYLLYDEIVQENLNFAMVCTSQQKKLEKLKVFTPKFGRRTWELEGLQDCVNQGIDYMRIDIS